MLENITEVLKLISQIASIALFVATIILGVLIAAFKKSGNKKLKKAADALELAKTAIVSFRSAAQTFMTEAEQFLDYSGEEKKVYVVTRLKEWCINNNVEYDESSINGVIEDLITFSKQVNAKKTTIDTVEKVSNEGGEVNG